MFLFIFQSLTDIRAGRLTELGGLDQVVQLLSQWRTHFDHFVLFLNTRIVQPIENDQFPINDDFNETNMRRGKDERH
ncbi:hypothetical protein [Raoultella terrigena]|uniref:hypothetical protein n=1 Tax=Raoultella terrigena TaxID=577 RepID=UPI00161C7BE8|nr:hypothetical protein [Raoultella terrigena]